MGPDYGIRIEIDSCVVYGSTMRTVRVNGDPGRLQRWIAFSQNTIDGCEIVNDTIEGAHHGIWSVVVPTVDILVDGNVIRYNTHENMLLQEGADDSAWTIQRNVFYGVLGDGYVDLLFDKTVSKYLDTKILYNTFCNADTGGYPLQFRNHYGTSDITLSGVEIVGNIFIGHELNIDVRVHNSGSGRCHVICKEFKNNAFDNITVTSGNSFSIANNAYTVAAANLSTQTSYGFVDSVNFNFELSPTSPLIGAGELTYGCLAYFGGGCTETAFNIGYYQSLSGEPETDTIPPNKIEDLGTIPSDQGWINLIPWKYYAAISSGFIGDLRIFPVALYRNEY